VRLNLASLSQIDTLNECHVMAQTEHVSVVSYYESFLEVLNHLCTPYYATPMGDTKQPFSLLPVIPV